MKISTRLLLHGLANIVATARCSRRGALRGACLRQYVQIG